MKSNAPDKEYKLDAKVTGYSTCLSWQIYVFSMQ